MQLLYLLHHLVQIFDFAVIESILVNNNNASSTTLSVTLTDASSNVF